MNPNTITIHWHGRAVEWCGYEFDPESGQGRAILPPPGEVHTTHTGDGEHILASEALEIFNAGKCVFFSKDLWHRGMMRPY